MKGFWLQSLYDGTHEDSIVAAWFFLVSVDLVVAVYLYVELGVVSIDPKYSIAVVYWYVGVSAR